MKKQGVLFLLIGVLTLSGCALNRSELKLEVAPLAAGKSNGKQVYVRSVTDSRIFENKPASPDIPSLKGGVDHVSAKIKSSAIGRKRNSYGKALGDYVLDGDQTVESVIYEATRDSLVSLGYEVTNEKEKAKPGAIVMDITIDKFWSWFAPGMWAIQIKSDIITTNSVNGQSIQVEAHGVKNYQIASNSNWKKTLAFTVEEFKAKAKTEFEKI